MNSREHWDRVYATHSPDLLSWFSPHLETSLSMIERATGNRSASIIDIGGGESTLVDDLLSLGYRNIAVLDISRTAIEVTKARLGEAAQIVDWLCADVTHSSLPTHSFDVWHDRAVFHFLTNPEQRAEYVTNVADCVKPGGNVIIGTFGPAGPAQCSGLDVMRYDASSLHQQFGRGFRLLESSSELHKTPFGRTQQFLYCWCVVE